MRYIYLFIICLLASYSASAQSHEWQWAETVTQPDNANTSATTEAVATDHQGNVFATGNFNTGSVQFGTYTLHNTDPTESTSDIFLVKYDPSGNVLWAISAGGPNLDNALSIKTDNSGNVYIAGYFYSDSIRFGPYTLYNYGPTDTTDDIFVAKYSSSGNVLWAKSFGGNYYDGANGVATDASGNVYIGGFYRSDSVLFGSHEYLDYSGNNSDNAYLLKCDSMGTFLWAVSSSASSNYVQVNALCTDPTGNVFAAGRFTGSTADFGGQTIQNQQVGYNDIFLVKYDSAGDALWAQDAGGSLNDIAYGVAADAQGNSYITGYFNSVTASFGSDQLNNDTTDNTGDIFLAKYDPNGNELWAQGFGGDQSDVGLAVATDTSSNVYITGYYLSPQIIFGNDTITNFDNTGATDDVFVGKFDQNGNPLLAVEAGGDWYDGGYGIATDFYENIYVGGFFRSDNIAFGSTTLDNSTSTYNPDLFVAKYASVSTGINNPQFLPSISLYPNPANDMIVAESQSFSSSDVLAAIYDVMGHIMNVEQSFSVNKITFNTSGLAAGMYLIKFTVGGKEANAKFVKVSDGQ